MEHVESDDGRRHTFRARTKKTFQQFRTDGVAEMRRSWASFLLTTKWQDQTLLMSAPGAHGTARLEGDTIVLDITLESFPATLPWVKERIVHDVSAMAVAISESSNLQAEEFESRVRIRNAARALREECLRLETTAVSGLARWEMLDAAFRVAVTLLGAGSAFAAWVDASAAPAWHYVASAAGLVVALVGSAQTAMTVSEHIKHWSDLTGELVRLKNDLQAFIVESDINPDFNIAGFQLRLQAFERRYADAEVLCRVDAWTRVLGVREMTHPTGAEVTA